MKSNDISELCAMSRTHGMLLVLAAMPGATITEKLALELECAADRHSISIGVMYDKVVHGNEQPPTEAFGRVYAPPEDASDQ